MTYALVFLAIVMATVITWLLRQSLNTEPWKADDPLENQPGRGILNIDPAKIGLLSFIAVVTSLFALFLSAYLMRMKLGDSLERRGISAHMYESPSQAGAALRQARS